MCVLWSCTDTLSRSLKSVTTWISENISLVSGTRITNGGGGSTSLLKFKNNVINLPQVFPSPMALFLNIWSLGCFLKCMFLNYSSSLKPRSEQLPCTKGRITLPFSTRTYLSWSSSLEALRSNLQAGECRHRNHALLLKGTNLWSNVCPIQVMEAQIYIMVISAREAGKCTFLLGGQVPSSEFHYCIRGGEWI